MNLQGMNDSLTDSIIKMTQTESTPKARQICDFNCLNVSNGVLALCCAPNHSTGTRMPLPLVLTEGPILPYQLTYSACYIDSTNNIYMHDNRGSFSWQKAPRLKIVFPCW